MSAPLQGLSLMRSRITTARSLPSFSHQYGRSPAYRRIHGAVNGIVAKRQLRSPNLTLFSPPLKVASPSHVDLLSITLIQHASLSNIRLFHTFPRLWQEPRQQDAFKDSASQAGPGFSFKPSPEKEPPQSGPGFSFKPSPEDESPLNSTSSEPQRRPESPKGAANSSSDTSTSDGPATPRDHENTASAKAQAGSEAEPEQTQGKEEEAGAKSDQSEQSEDQKSSSHGEERQEKQDSSKHEQAREEAPPHGSKSPWQVFTETLQSEFKASKEWNESTKALASSAHEFTQNETLQRMRAGYGAASGAAATGTARVLKTTGKAIGQSAAWTWDTAPVRGIRAGMNATGRGVEKATRPLRETSAYKSVRDVIDDGSSSRYGGWTEKEERRRKREDREAEDIASGRRPRTVEKMEEDPDAGTNVTLHKDAAWKESWRNFRDSSKIFSTFSGLKHTYAESENPLISTARSISDRVAGFFAENETANVIKAFRAMDPHFQLEPFLQDMREYILPEVLDAYVKGDVETLKLWLSAAQFQVYDALMRQYTTNGLKSDGRILDIRNVDVLSARLLDPGDIPVFILTCRTQEVHVYRHAKSGELAAGMEDKVQQVTYAIGVTRLPEEVNNPETRGWRLIELQKSARDYV